MSHWEKGLDINSRQGSACKRRPRRKQEVAVDSDINAVRSMRQAVHDELISLTLRRLRLASSRESLSAGWNTCTIPSAVHYFKVWSRILCTSSFLGLHWDASRVVLMVSRPVMRLCHQRKFSRTRVVLHVCRWLQRTTADCAQFLMGQQNITWVDGWWLKGGSLDGLLLTLATMHTPLQTLLLLQPFPEVPSCSRHQGCYYRYLSYTCL